MTRLAVPVSDLGAGQSSEIEEDRRLLYVAMTRAKDDLHLMIPQRFFTHAQTAYGDRHMYTSRTRFIPNSILGLFENTTWPIAAPESGRPIARGVQLDVAARTVLSMKHELRVMQVQGNGRIVNISSTYGHRGAGGASIYVASKHAVEGLTKSVALEAASYGVRVNAVAPGPIDTGMLDRFTGSEEGKAHLGSTTAQKRIGQPEEIAAAIVFAASEGTSYLTGHILSVDGGKSAG
jgi:hypothetical protein